MHGKLLQFLGAVLMGSAFFAFFVLQFYRGTHLSTPTWQVFAVGLPIMLLLMALGNYCLSTGRKIRVQSAQPLAESDPRPPVLYLRSFKDDPVAAQGPQFVMPTGGAVGGLLTSFVGAITTEEEQLAKAMDDIGPMLAIGKPGEALPELGARRIYVSDAEWQTRVRELMSRARLVVLRAGETAGFWWEVERVAREIAPEKILFLLPQDAKQYEAFRQKAQTLLPCQLPPYPSKAGSAIGSIRAILFFESNWTPHLVPVQRTGQSVDWVREFKRSLEPLFNQLQIQWSKPSGNFVHWLWLLLYLIIGIALLVGIVWLIQFFAQ
jgi:hypothetical protein